MKRAGCKMRSGIGHRARGESMLVPYTMTSNMTLRMVVILLSISVSIALLLVFASYTWLHEPLMVSTIHHHVLALLMALVVHPEVIVGRRLGYR